MGNRDRGLEAAIDAVRSRAAPTRSASIERVRVALSGEPAASDVDELTDAIRRSARLTLNFHPDRLDNRGRTVARGLRDDGRYRPQCETGISNGARSAVPGGDRTYWEHALFDRTYNGDEHDERASLIRPVYGALDITHDPLGGSPRFGSSYVVLADSCFERATFCVGDSHAAPTDVGTIVEFDAVLAGLLEEATTGDALGRGLHVDELIRLVREGITADEPSRTLDGYVEAQIHGSVDLGRDVDAIVVDPSFIGTDVASDLRAAAVRYQFDLRWHTGSELAVSDVPVDFRGPPMPDVARRTARPDGIVDAASIGRSLAGEPFTSPSPRGDDDHGVLQQHKFLWHCLLRFGSATTP